MERLSLLHIGYYASVAILAQGNTSGSCVMRAFLFLALLNDLERSSVLLRLYYITVAILAQGNTSG